MSPHDSSRRSGSKSLTPQRKHRKLLKDGSGTEVWPENIESVFVQGLREYWDSPWAAYSQSRGRSRWRNQFLVDYLQRAGINRTKKQVASHIQVLRNMWKGEPEFYLVAGGEELSEPGVLDQVKIEDDTLILIDFDDRMSSHSTSPDFSPPDSNGDFPPSPSASTTRSPGDIYTPLHVESPNSLTQANLDLAASRPDIGLSGDAFNGSPTRPTLRKLLPPDGRSTSPLNSSSLGFSQDYRGRVRSSPATSELWASNIPPISVQTARNRVTAISVLADGMTPFSVKVDALASPQDTSRSTLALKIKLYITSIDDIRSLSTLHGFAASVCLANIWSNSGGCITRVYTNNICASEEVSPLEISCIEAGTAIVVLPESSLSRCRWFDAAVQTSLTQEIIVDGETLLYILYDLDRKNGGVMPTAELVGYQRYNSLPVKQSPVASSSSQYDSLSTVQSASCSRRSPQTSISCALTPANGTLRHFTTASISF